MPMRMGVRFARRITRGVLVLMVLIVHVGVRMLHQLVRVLMLVMLRQMQPHAEAHEQAGRNQLNGHGLSQEHNGRERAQKWCR